MVHGALTFIEEQQLDAYSNFTPFKNHFADSRVLIRENQQFSMGTRPIE